MTLQELFERSLVVPYKHLIEETASFYFERRGTTLFIYFECSNGETDWKNNFDFPAKPYRSMPNTWFAHRGFLRTWKAIEPYLVEDISDPQVTSIVVTGYSHGAAIALLCHEYCKFHRPGIRVEGYGFGCPRVVWGLLSKQVKSRFEGFTVVRNGEDIVTHVPPALFGFRHVGNLLHIGKYKGYGLVKSHYSSSISTELALLNIYITEDK